MPVGSVFCSNLFDVYPVKRVFPGFGDIGILTAIFASMYITTTVIIIYWIKRQEWFARQGDHEAVKSVIFPVFVRVLWLNAFVNLYVGLLMLTGHGPSEAHDTLGVAFLYGIMWALQHMAIEGVALLLMQKGLGVHAAKQTAKYTAAWGVFTFIVVFISSLNATQFVNTFFLWFWEIAMFLFYGLLWKCPLEYLYRRPAAVWYGKIWFIYRIFILTTLVLKAFTPTEAVSNCCNLFFRYFCFAFFQPFVTYQSFLLDSTWWQGNGAGEWEEDPSPTQCISSPLAGMNVNLQSAQSLAHTLDQMKGNQGVRLLNFAYIKLFSDKVLGQGSFSKVYKGTYKREECAIKLIYTLDLTVDVISRVAVEAQILSRVKHPNIVHIMGVAVLPPSVCILLELCALGSLSDVIRPNSKAVSARGFVHKKMTDIVKLHLCFADIVYLMLGCSRGLERLHQFSPDMCHRDVKSMNFLVDEHLVAKVADLELGVGKDSTSIYQEGQAFLPNWAAPEVVQVNGRHSQASDVFSLGIVLWEMLSKKIPFSDVSDRKTIAAMIIKGERPPIDKYKTSNIDPRYISLIKQAWHCDINQRPNISDMTNELQEIWSSVLTSKVHGYPEVCIPSDLLPSAPVLQRTSFINSLKKNVPSSANASINTSMNVSFVSALQSLKLDRCWSLLEAGTGLQQSWAVFSIASPHILLYANYSWLADFEHTPGDMTGFAALVSQTDDCVIHWDKLQAFLRSFASMLPNQHVLECVRKDSSSGIYSLHSFPIIDRNWAEESGGGCTTPNRDRKNPANKQSVNGSSVEYVAILFSHLSDDVVGSVGRATSTASSAKSFVSPSSYWPFSGSRSRQTSSSMLRSPLGSSLGVPSSLSKSAASSLSSLSIVSAGEPHRSNSIYNDLP